MNFFKQASSYGLTNIQILEVQDINASSETRNDKIEKEEISNVSTYMVSAEYQGKRAKIQTDQLEEKDYIDIISLLIEKAKYLEIEEKKEDEEIRREDTQIKEKDFNLKEVTPYLLSLNNIREKYQEIKNIECLYNQNRTIRTLSTSNGTYLKSCADTILFYIEMSAEKGEDRANVSKRFLAKTMSLPQDEKIQILIETLLKKLVKKEVKTGRYTILLKNDIAHKIICFMIPLFSADNIGKGLSFLKDYENKKVYSEKITMIEDPKNENLCGYRPFDNEGVQTYRKVIIQNGTFIQKLYDKKTAEEQNVKSTGNNYDTISVRNLYIENGEKSEEELIRSIPNGILIDSVSGLNSGVNLANGNLSFQASGFKIENGNVKDATETFILSTNYRELFSNVIEVGNDLEFFSSTAGSPSLVIKNITVVGKEK